MKRLIPAILISGLMLWISLSVATRFKKLVTEEEETTIVLKSYVVFQENSYLLKFKNLTVGNDIYLIVKDCCPCNFKNKINKKFILKQDQKNLPNQISNLEKIVCE
jgi:hypothetical protein